MGQCKLCVNNNRENVESVNLFMENSNYRDENEPRLTKDDNLPKQAKIGNMQIYENLKDDYEQSVDIYSSTTVLSKRNTYAEMSTETDFERDSKSKNDHTTKKQDSTKDNLVQLGNKYEAKSSLQIKDVDNEVNNLIQNKPSVIVKKESKLDNGKAEDQVKKDEVIREKVRVNIHIPIPAPPSFEQLFLNEINQCRTHPHEYAKKLRSHIAFMIPNDDGEDTKSKYIYENQLHKGPKVLLKEGPDAVESFHSFLEGFPPINPIKYNPSLNLILPPKSDWVKKDKYTKILFEKKKEMKNNNLLFHFDIGFSCAETNAFLQLVDDNVFFSHKRRLHLLSPGVKEMGISKVTDGKKTCTYICMLFETE